MKDSLEKLLQRINQINRACALVTLTFENEVRDEEIISFDYEIIEAFQKLGQRTTLLGPIEQYLDERLQKERLINIIHDELTIINNEIDGFEERRKKLLAKLDRQKANTGIFDIPHYRESEDCALYELMQHYDNKAQHISSEFKLVVSAEEIVQKIFSTLESEKHKSTLPAKKKETLVNIIEQLLLHAIMTAATPNDQRRIQVHLTKIKELLNKLESLVMQDSELNKESSLRDLFSALAELSLIEKMNPVPVKTQGSTHYLLQKFGYPTIGSFFDTTPEEFFGLAPITTQSNTTTEPANTNDCPQHTSTPDHRAYIEKLFAHFDPDPLPAKNVVSEQDPTMFAKTTSGNPVIPPRIHKPTPLRADAAPSKQKPLALAL